MEILQEATYLGIDSETDLIAPQNLAPKLICVSTALFSPSDPEADENGFVSDLMGNGEAGLESGLRSLLEDPLIHFVAANAKYDFIVFAKAFTSLVPLIWNAYANERIHCTVAREKVLNLSDSGRIAKRQMPDGSRQQIGYRLADMEKEYLGLDRSAQKEGDDIWRLNFNSLDGMTAAQYPEEAATYAKEDAVGCLRVFYAQQQRQQNVVGPVSLATSEFQASVDFALGWMTDHGIKIDPVYLQKATEEIKEATKPENFQMLMTSGILRPDEPPRPFKRASSKKIAVSIDDLDIAEKRALIAGCWTDLKAPEKVEMTAGGRIVASAAAFSRLHHTVVTAPPELQLGPNCQQLLGRVEDVPTFDEEPKMTKGKKGSINKKRLEQLVAQMREVAGLPVVYSNPTEPDPTKLNVCCKEDIVSEISHLSPVLEQFQTRAKMQKLVNTEIPRMSYPDGTPAEVVHFNFNILVETTRTSSYAGGTRKDKTFLYPSANGQNIDPRVRPCYEGRDGWLLLSTDYSSVELVSAAHRQLELFGHSKLGELIAEGVDLHAYMGSVLAYNLSDEFRATYDQSHVSFDERTAYDLFMSCKASPDEDLRAFFKHWRKFAKPVGLGFPGGLGAATFVSFAKGYEVVVTVEMAKTLKALWLRTFPEFKEGFDWINHTCKDDRWPVIGYKKTGEPISGYAYTTPMGAYRAACAYTSAANGSFLQTPTAEGAKMAVFDVVRACYDTSRPGPLLGCRPLDFIHDEILTEIPEDGFEHERAAAIEAKMVDAMSAIFPRLPVRVESALMRRWRKQAELVIDENGRLAVWEPKGIAA